MIKLKKITAVSEIQPLIKNINLEINPGEIHAVMGAKHSGKSALAHIIAGHPSIQLTEGIIRWNNKKFPSEAEQRAKLGIFVSFQYPPEFESITNFDLIKECLGTQEKDIAELFFKYNEYCELLDLSPYHGDCTPSLGSMNMSQAKRNELLYMFLSNPKLIILDEIDTGLSEEEVVLVGSLLKDFLTTKKGCLVITHNKTLLSILNPTHVHVMVDGEIKLSGETELYTRIIEDGYSEFS